ncbi:Na+/H+ antiporter NhaC [Sedimentibacter hydroxybenzoicus DSM 7310]|uniref:Na+/H+ antiporter NhaC n=1 Tax=Sedimentibacter hydroxybenzoicus DSM 7310 TaxID=1123245 RepID=A0A974BN62_SEDHY|nr:Na+/H+ antiporter NhaC [Sedimentibacter hydroxybenzoicus]NYB76078.1 Na+/H+ antiporter NhaC [Sedimentibacter hydroxybenzoicus DSM 7310]
MGKVPKQKKEPSLLISIIPVIVTVLIIGIVIIKYDGEVHIPILLGAVTAAVIATFSLGFTWKEIEQGIVDSIGSTMQAILILAIIGVLIGTWIAGGIVPTMIYYGLQILSPTFFLAASLILCSIVALATGSSWTTAGTVGIALIGIAQGLGVPVPLAAGAIISGAYFGDKISPLSDTTNLAPGMAGSTLFDHIKHMLYTTSVSYGITLVIFLAIGFQFAGQELDTHEINGILQTIESIYVINPLLLVVPVIVIVMVAMKVPAIPGLVVGCLLGAVCAVFQGQDFGSLMDIANNGVVAETGHEVVDELLTNGGLQSMMWTISLIMCALTFGGVLEKTGMMATIANRLLVFAKNTGSLILVTAVTCLFVNTLCGDQYLAIALPGKMYKDTFAERGLAPRNLSRILEDSGTVTSALIPWNTCGATMSGFLGVPTFAYLPYAFFNLLSPIVSVIYAYMGISIMTLEEDPSSEQYVRPMKLKKSPKELEEYIANYKNKHANA